MNNNPTGWSWDTPIEETAYYIWLANGGYQDHWIMEVKDYMKWNGNLTSRHRELTKHAHDYYFHKVIKPTL